MWDASIIFAKYVEISSDFSVSSMAGKRVLELGSGCGLGGLALMMRGAAVTLTDLPLVTSSLTSINAARVFGKLHSLGAQVVDFIRPIVAPIDWRDHSLIPSTFPDSDRLPFIAFEESYDVVLLTDCVFSRSLVKDLVLTILKYCAAKSELICCHEIRDEVVKIWRFPIKVDALTHLNTLFVGRQWSIHR